jgi:hypothetical protein
LALVVEVKSLVGEDALAEVVPQALQIDLTVFVCSILDQSKSSTVRCMSKKHAYL